jgi:two-component system, OmpR family, copper resistance phosphate regulon response regulator CusR
MPALILCIDDQPIALWARQRVLATGKHEVISVDNPTLAMELFLDLSVDIVVLDNYLGDTTGVELAREMKRHKPQVPILLISGAIDRPEASDVYDQFLSTLAGPQELLQSVEALLVRKVA